MMNLQLPFSTILKKCACYSVHSCCKIFSASILTIQYKISSYIPFLVQAYSRLLLSLPVGECHGNSDEHVTFTVPTIADVMMSAKDNYSHTDTSLMESRYNV